MKRTLILLFLSLFVCSAVTASSINGDYKGSPIVKVNYEGQELPYSDVPAVIENNRTMVPLYLLKEAGFNVDWNNADYTVDISQPRKIVSLADIQRMANCVKMVQVYDGNGKYVEQGTGFIVSLDGEMITASHVLNKFSKVTFNYGAGYTFNNMDFNNTLKDVTGITLGKLPGHENDVFPYLKISSRIPKVGERVYAIGYPDGKFSLTQGVVKAIMDSGSGYEDHSIGIEHNALIAPGSSGGPLLDQYGEVIGLHTGANSGSGEYFIGIATSSIYIQQELDKLQK